MSHLLLIISAAFILLLSVPFQALAGSITGKITVKGLRSPANVLVYVVKAPDFSADLSNVKFIMDQKNLTFIPHILPVLVGSTVNFPNDDKVAHNVFSLSRTKKFNLGSYKPGTAKTILFDKPGIVELRCDVHAEMGAYIMVLKNPYWAVSDAKGNFKIPDPAYLDQHGIKGVPDLPPGKYLIKTWHEKLKTVKKMVEVTEKGETTLRLSLTRGNPSVLYK
jgi:plastocyanin